MVDVDTQSCIPLRLFFNLQTPTTFDTLISIIEGLVMENLRIGIIGNIGVGKSTLIERMKAPEFSKKLLSLLPEQCAQNLHTFPETFSDEVLDAFYKDPEKHAFTAQIEFFNGRLARQKRISQASGIILEDRTIFEDYHIFGKAQKILNRLTHAEYLAYQRNFQLMTQHINEPDLVVYLQADTPTLLKRIAQRGRDSEQAIEPSYLNLLNELYEAFIQRHTHCPVLIIQAEETQDLDQYYTTICDQIMAKIKETKLNVITPKLNQWVSIPETDGIIKAIKAERALSTYLKEHPSLITIGGNMGLGKSTLAAIMQQSLNIQALYENPLKNPLLEQFLKDKKTHCFALQKSFLKTRSLQRRQGKSGDDSYVKDRSLAEDILIFCRQFHQDGLLTALELDQLTTLFHQASKTLPQADLMIVLQGTPELAWQRILQRGRTMEIKGGWSEQEVHSMGRYYQSYADDVRRFGYHTNPIVEIDVNRLDITNRIHLGYIFERILETLKAYHNQSSTSLTALMN